jgi:hypothetical protein
VESSVLETQQLIERVAKLYPDYGATELLRMALLLALQFPSLSATRCDTELQQQCQEIGMQLSAAGDQHAAVAEELDSLATTTPCDFSPSHLWTLVRAIKVQSQLLNLYLGPQNSLA